MTQPGNYSRRQLSCFTRSVTGCAILLEPHVFHIHTVQLRPQKLRYHVAVTYAIHCYCISGLIFEQVRPNHSASPKSAPNSGSLCMQWLFMNHSRILSAPNPTVLCVHEPIKLKARLIAKDDFLRKITAHFLVFQHPINKFSALHMVCWLDFLRPLHFVSMQMLICRDNSLHGASRNAQVL